MEYTQGQFQRHIFESPPAEIPPSAKRSIYASLALNSLHAETCFVKRCNLEALHPSSAGFDTSRCISHHYHILEILHVPPLLCIRGGVQQKLEPV